MTLFTKKVGPVSLIGAALIAVAALAFTAAAHAQTVTGTVMTTENVPNFASFSNLAVGSRGSEVSDLQGFLGEAGYFTAGLPTGYFGSITKGSLAAYQASVDLPSTGYFGSMTKAYISNYIANIESRLGVNSGLVNVTLNLKTNSGSINTGSISTNGTSMSASLAPLGQTGYWQNGSWYAAIPATSTTNIAGYWQNGTWYPMNNAQNMSTSLNTQNSAGGYWYNGTWYPNGNSSTTASYTGTYGVSSSAMGQGTSSTASTNTTTGRSCSYQQTMSNGTAYVCQ